MVRSASAAVLLTCLLASPAAAQTRKVVPAPKITAPPSRFATPPKATIVPRPVGPAFQAPMIGPRPGGGFISDAGGAFRPR